MGAPPPPAVPPQAAPLAARRTPLGLIGLDRWTPLGRLGSGLAVLALGVGVGWGSYLLQVHFRQRLASGDSLAGWQNALRLGAPWPPLVPIAVAAVLLALGWWRLRHAEPEPSHGLLPGAGREWTASELRRHLRRERGAVRGGFGLLSLLWALTAIRFGVYAVLALAGDRTARGTLVGVTLEVVVCTAAWVAGSAWIAAYLERLEQWGVRD